MTKITDMVASNKKFSELVQAKIKTFIAANMNPDDAVAAAYTQAKKELTGRDSIARMSREMQFYYLEDGKWVPKIKSFDELKKAVDELNGRPLRHMLTTMIRTI